MENSFLYTYVIFTHTLCIFTTMSNCIAHIHISLKNYSSGNHITRGFNNFEYNSSFSVYYLLYTFVCSPSVHVQNVVWVHKYIVTICVVRCGVEHKFACCGFCCIWINLRYSCTMVVMVSWMIFCFEFID